MLQPSLMMDRPLLLIVGKPEHSLEREEILAFLAEQLVKWWIPNEVIFLDYRPVGGTGKVQKRLYASATAAHIFQRANNR